MGHEQPEVLSCPRKETSASDSAGKQRRLRKKDFHQEGDRMGDHEPTGAHADLLTLMRQLRDEADTNHTHIAERTGFSRQQVSAAFTGREIPSPDLADALDIDLGGAGDVRRLRDVASRERQARRIGAALSTRQPPAQPHNSAEPVTSQPLAGLREPRPLTVSTGDTMEEVSSSRRRDLLGTGIVLAAGATAAGTADATTRAARISRAIAASAPDPLSIAQLQYGVQRLSAIYSTTPPTELLPPVEAAWGDAETRLETRVSATDRRELDLLAGQYAFYRGRIAFDSGDDEGALTFFILAGQHAEAAGHAVLIGSVAVMRSAIAFFNREFQTAAAIAAQAESRADPYIVPLLATAQARAHALGGRRDDALSALRTMNDSVWTSKPLPGPSPLDEEASQAFNAVVLGYLGKGEAAETHARRSLEMLAGTGRYRSTAGTQLALSRSFIHRTHPDPEQAALAACDAMTTVAGKESVNGPTVGRAAGIHRQIASRPDWARLPAVRDLAERLPVRYALPPGQIV